MAEAKVKPNGANTSMFFEQGKAINEEVQKTLDAKIRRFRDAQQWKKPDKTPLMGHMITWQFVDAGYSLDVAGRDYDVKRDAMIHAVTSYKFDHINCINSGFRNTWLINDSLCGTGSTGEGAAAEDSDAELLHSDGKDGNLNVVFEGFIQPEHYQGLLDNYDKTVWENILFKRYPQAAKYTPQQFAEAAKTMVDYNKARENLDKELRYIYGDPMEMQTLHFGTFVDDLFNTFIGIKSLGIAMRRHKAALLDLCLAMDERRFAGFMAAADGLTDVQECYDYTSGLLSGTIMSRKQFEEFHAPYLKKFLDYAQSRGKQTYFWTEGSFDHVGEFFNDYKKGTVTLMIETDDPFYIRKKYPNICLQGGLFCAHLGNGTPEENIADAKRAIDELGADGGLVLAADKMLTYGRDMKRENLIAIGDFLETYNG